jgi:hypothetical protein
MVTIVTTNKRKHCYIVTWFPTVRHEPHIHDMYNSFPEPLPNNDSWDTKLQYSGFQ